MCLFKDAGLINTRGLFGVASDWAAFVIEPLRQAEASGSLSLDEMPYELRCLAILSLHLGSQISFLPSLTRCRSNVVMRPAGKGVSERAFGEEKS